MPVASLFDLRFEIGGLVRGWANYEVMDAVNASFGFVDYIGGEKPFLEAIKNNDKVFTDITYSF